MAVFKCKMCGGTLEINNETVAVCEYCGTKQTLPSNKDDIVNNLFNRANNLRIKSEFDKAEEVYKTIIKENGTESEAYWGLILCKYGIEYVDDPKTHTRVPTCHRTSYDAIMTDADYLAAIEYADASQKIVYEEEARAIDAVQKNILSVVKNEEPFDVFICYKETDENGKRTVDSTIANDIYHQLTQEGLKVFYAAITLEDKLGVEYEPYIFAALNSAKVMLAIGTKPEYFNAVWVKNEWSRFLKIMKNDRFKLIIPCFKDMDAYDLPEEFSHLQAQDMSKIGFINDVVRGIKKVITPEVKETTIVQTQVVENSNGNVQALLDRGFMALEDGNWKKADDFFEQALNFDAKLAKAYLGKFMAELCVHTEEELCNCKEPFDNNDNYAKVIRFGDEALKTKLERIIENINIRKENDRLERLYNDAVKAMRSSAYESSYKSAAKLFESIMEYKDSSTLAKECYEKAEEARIEDVYFRAKGKMVGSVSNYEKAIELFKSIPGWKDSDEKIIYCKETIERLKAEEKDRVLKRERQEQATKAEAERIANRNKKITILGTTIVCVTIIFIILLINVIIPNIKYKDAMTQISEGNIIEAYEVLITLNGHKDSKDKANSIHNEYVIEKIKNARVGGDVKFGLYEQNNKTSDGKEEIEWLILDVKEDKALLISKYALDCKPYNTEDRAVTWETCSLRKWLNDDFLNDAFTTSDLEIIYTTTIYAENNHNYSTNYEIAVQDKVFILSVDEAKRYFDSDNSRECLPTTYTIVNGASINDPCKDGFSDGCWWWIRKFDNSKSSYTNYVLRDGGVGAAERPVCDDGVAIRPAMWIDLGL